MTTAYVISAYIGGGIILGLFIVEGIALYWEMTLKQELLSYFSNSPGILTKATSKRDSLILKLMFIGAIAGAVAQPAGYIKRGELSADDLQNLPLSLKRKLVIMHWTVTGLLAALPIHYWIFESGWLE